jgi:hypothetical protein
MQDTGYITDIDYPQYFHRDLAPIRLSFACGMAGFEPPIRVDNEFTYLELGAGSGTTASVLAAAYPHSRFYCADFNRRHVATADRIISAAGLDNLTATEASFADLAAGRVAMPQFDFIVMSGVYSWVDEEQRTNVRSIVKNYLKEHGLVFVNYNAMPGWATTVPMQRLVKDYVSGLDGSRADRVSAARRLIDRAVGTGAEYFKVNERAVQLNLDSFIEGDVGYVAHEYMNNSWDPRFHHHVAAEFSDIGLDYLASVDPLLMYRDVRRSPEQRALLSEITDPAMRETMRDFFDNTQFRREVYARGARRLSPATQREWLDAVALCAAPGERAASNVTDGNRSADLLDDPLRPILDAIEEAPLTLSEVARIPSLQGVSFIQLTTIAGGLVGAGRAMLCLPKSKPADAAHRLNRVLAELAQTDATYYAFASPLLGSGVRFDLFQALVYLSMADGVRDHPAVVDRVMAGLKNSDKPIKIGDLPVKSAAQVTREEVAMRVAQELDQQVPAWQRCDII